MLNKSQTNIEFLPKWKCPYEDCGAENDITNPVRCWKCNKKKPTEEQRAIIQASIQDKKNKQDAAGIAEKKELMQIKEDDYNESSTAVQSDDQDTNLEFNLDKLES